MVYIDHSRQPLVLAIETAKESVKNAQLELKCYDNFSVISGAKLEIGKDYSFGTGRNILAGARSLEKCVFDGGILKIASPIVGGTDITDHALYKCPKCSTLYDLHLNPQDKKRHDKAMKTMVFR